MNGILSPAIEARIEREVSAGRYRDRNQLVEDALQDFLDRRQRDESRVQALRRIAQAVDHAGLYERVLLPDRE
jgi:Arc/MetJ-type ribon-helix-helix transcriptional regulator